MAVLTGKAIYIAQRMALRSKVSLHLAVPGFDRRIVLAQCRAHGFKGRTLKQARVWVDEYCDALGIPRDAGIPAKYARPLDTAQQ
jgi:hypothetical protein